MKREFFSQRASHQTGYMCTTNNTYNSINYHTNILKYIIYTTHQLCQTLRVSHTLYNIYTTHQLCQTLRVSHTLYSIYTTHQLCQTLRVSHTLYSLYINHTYIHIDYTNMLKQIQEFTLMNMLVVSLLS